MIINELVKQAVPYIYYRNGIACYLDPYRNRLIQITPEETVRQQVALYFESHLNVPHEMLLLEQHMSHYGIQGKERADIVVLRFDAKNQTRYPIAVIECKSPCIPITEKTLNQALRYADALGCDYVFTTNGTEFTAHKYIEQNNTYIPISSIPNYVDMLGSEYTPLTKEPVPQRTPIAELNDKNILSEYAEDIGIDSSDEIRAACLNMWEGLLDVKHMLNAQVFKRFELIRDYGIRISSYGNQSGSFSGPYRSFLIKDMDGNAQFVSLAFRSHTRQEKEGQPEKTYLCVAVDNYDKSHHALQLSMDTYAQIKNNQLSITHNGSITVGHKGSFSKADFISYLEKECPELVLDKTVVVGSVNLSNLLYVDALDYKDMIVNLITYALVRDKYRLKYK